jgi:hypothetical protein
MPKYVFAYHNHENRFVERHRVLPADASAAADHPDEGLDGTVPHDGVEALMRNMREKFPEPTYDVASAYANKWSAVVRNFRGMRDH